ncbi:MAG: aldolase/citrate lyase family protein [Pirellulaceae bacterium]|nr:aldolase/citrate lyase family protein [Pirellulaceae bacterium]
MMRRSRALAKIRAGQPVRMCSLGRFSPPFVRWAAHCGFDCIWLDQEHNAMDLREWQGLLAHFHLYDIDCLFRAPTAEKTPLYRYLEEGATGLMIPLVSTAERARQLVQAVKFPPLGDRGLDGAGMDADFYVNRAAGYVEHANRETMLVVQVETIEAVNNADQIAAVPGVDGIFIGPGDLGLRLAHAPNCGFDLPGAVARVAAACQRHGKAWGMPARNTEHLRELTAQGAQLANHGSDFFAMMNELEAKGRDWESIVGGANA